MIFNRVAPAGGAEINGIVESYKVSTGSVTAGGFVEFVEDYDISGTDVPLIQIGNAGINPRAILLQDGRVFVLHIGSGNKPYASIVSTSNTNITIEFDTMISSKAVGTGAGRSFDIIVLQNGDILVAYKINYDGTKYDTIGMALVRVSVSSLTVLSDAIYDSNAYSGTFIKLVLLQNGTVFLAHSYDTYCTLRGRILTVSGSTITMGTDTVISNVQYSAKYLDAVLLPTGNVFIAHDSASPVIDSLFSVVVSISGNTVTPNSSYALNNTICNTGSRIKCQLLSDGNVLVAHSYDSSNSNYNDHLAVIIASISGTTITKGVDTVILNSELSHAKWIDIIYLPSGKCIIGNRLNLGATNALWGVWVSISGNTVTAITNSSISGTTADTASCFSFVLLPGGRIFVAHTYSASSYLYGLISTFFKIKSYSNVIGGVAKVAGTAGQTIDIIMPST